MEYAIFYTGLNQREYIEFHEGDEKSLASHLKLLKECGALSISTRMLSDDGIFDVSLPALDAS
jgi:hypothetical protein